MKQHLVEITFNGTDFSVPDEPMCYKNGDTIQWRLTGTDGASGKIVAGFVVFHKTNGSPFDQTTFAGPELAKFPPQPVKPTHPKHNHSYTVFALLQDGSLHWKDPQIIFEDVVVTGGAGSEVVDISTSASTVFDEMLGDLKKVHDNTSDPKSKFFPGGINNVQFSLTASGVSVSLTISGPPAKSLSEG